MSRKPVFTLSLDCEGLWGIADQYSLLSSTLINDVTLKETYEFIVKTLSNSELLATAAFVTCFAAHPDSIYRNLKILEELESFSPIWFLKILQALKRRELNGWVGNNYYNLFRKEGYEMAWHGATHMLLSDQTNTDAIKLEVELTKILFKDMEQDLGTIIFPRNLVGNLELLKNSGFDSYRASPQFNFFNRYINLINEWNIFDNRVGSVPRLQDGWNVTPPGYFLNWPHGVRSLVPIPVTVSRWKSLIHHTLDQCGYLHMWFHPHNLITAPLMRAAFEEIIKEVGVHVKSGDMLSLTIAQANQYYILEDIR